MNMIENFVQTWWPQIVAFVIMIAWLNRQAALHENRIHQLEKKVETIFQLWNKQIDRMLDRTGDK